MKSIADNLIAIRESIFEQDHVVFLLGGLAADYNSFVVSITSKHEPLHSEEIHSMLLSYEHRLEQQNATGETNHLKASIAFLQSQGNNYKINQRTGQCKFQRRNLSQSLIAIQSETVWSLRTWFLFQWKFR